MTTIPAGSLTKLREQKQYSNIYLSVLNPDKLLQARVNNGAITRGARSIAYDSGTGTAGQYARIVSGQTLWIGSSAGTYDVGKVRVKSIAGNQIAGTITIAENGIDWADDLYLTIIDFYDIWPIPPFINPAGVFYKDYNIAYTDQNEDIYPVAIMGPHRAGFLSGGSLVFTLDGSDSYAMANGAAISSYAWSATGGAIGNAAIATTTITFNAPGYYWVTLTVTDDNGKSQLTRRCYFVYNNTTDTPYRNFSVTNCGGDWNSAGWQFSIDAFGDIELNDFPDGTLCLLWHQNYISDIEDYVNIWDIGNEVICAGYLQRDVDTDDLAESGTGSVSFDVISPTLYLQQKNIGATVAIEANNSPAEWNEFITAVCTAGRAVHHLLRWHSTVIQTCDVLGLTDNALQVYQVAFSEDSLLDMVNAFAFERGIFAKLVSAKDGRLYFVEDSNYLDQTDRNALDTIFSIIAQDLSGTPQLAREPLQRTSLAFMDGFDFDGTPPGDAFTFLIPGYTAGSVSYPIPEFWGRGSLQKTRQILNNEADGQMKCGRVIANANNPLRELRLDFRANYLGAFDIVPNAGWYNWGIANSVLKRELDLLNTKWICRRVSLRFNTTGGEISTSVILEGECFGPDGITAEYPVEYPTPTPPTPNWDIATLEALLAAGSVWYRNENASDWTEINSTDNWTFVAVDPFWNNKNDDDTPQNVIYWTISNGLWRTSKISGSPVSKDIPTDPPDSFSDTPDITESDLTYKHFVPDPNNENVHFVIIEAQNGSSEYRGWIARTETDGVSWQYGDLFDGTAPDEIRPIWTAVNGTYVYITIWEKDGATEKLWLVELDKSDLSWSTRYDLGACSDTELFDTYEAYPLAAQDDDNDIWVYGRMNSPGAVGGSANPEHIIGTTDGGSNWTSIENGQGAAIVKALEISDDVGGDRTYSAVLERP